MLLNCILISVFCIVLHVHSLHVFFFFFLIEHDIVWAYLLVYYDMLDHVTFDHLEV